jgi:hypothetical protein
MPKSRASYLKRQREIANKEKRQAKLQRRLDRRAAADEPPRAPESAPDAPVVDQDEADEGAAAVPGAAHRDRDAL